MLENRKYKRVGLTCPNPKYDYIKKDSSELEEEQEEETESINKLEND